MAFSLDDFLCELRNTNLSDIQATTDVSDAINTYNSVLDMVINNHAPKTTRKTKRTLRHGTMSQSVMQNEYGVNMNAAGANQSYTPTGRITALHAITLIANYKKHDKCITIVV